MGEERRLLLEVLKWLTPKDVLLGTDMVSWAWSKVGQMDELWREFIGAVEGHPGRLKDVFRYDVYRPTYMPVLIDNTIHRVSLSTWEMQAIVASPDLLFVPGMRLLFLHNNDLLLCGGWKTTKCTLILSRNRALQPFSELPFDKSSHGLVEVHKVVYSFGGYTDGKATADTLSVPVSSPNWTSKAAMTVPRCEISPSVLGCEVFIPGGFDTTVEKYSTESDSFELLSIAIPQETAATAIAFNLLLILLTPKERLIATIDGEKRVGLRSLELWWAGHSDQAPFVYRGKCYLSVHKNDTAHVYCYDLMDNTFARREINML